MPKDDEWSGLLKIPAEIVISELRVKLGAQESYIGELEHKLKQREPKDVKESKLLHLEKEVERLELKLKDAESRLGDMGRRNRTLESQLLNILKEKQNAKTVKTS
jgi:chromosome segregation ATPase